MRRVLILDAGQSGALVSADAKGRDPFALRGSVERLSRDYGTFTLGLAASDPAAREIPALGHGLLTYALLSGFGAVNPTPVGGRPLVPAGPEPVTEAIGWFSHAGEVAARLGRHYQGREPDVQIAGVGLSFPLLSLAKAGPAPADGPPITPPTPRPPAPVGPPVPAGRVLHVLTVGVGRAAEPSLTLDYADDDARAIAAAFARPMPGVWGGVAIEAPLLDEGATVAAIRAALRRIADQADADDVALIHLSAHGVSVGSRFYLIPYEFRRTPGRPWADDVRDQGLPVDLLGRDLEGIRAGTVILAIDACHSGGAFGVGEGVGDPAALRDQVERLGQGRDLFVIAAAPAGRQALEGKRLRHGVLSYALLAGLGRVEHGPLAGRRASGADGGGRLMLLDWLNFATGEVPRLLPRDEDGRLAPGAPIFARGRDRPLYEFPP